MGYPNRSSTAPKPTRKHTSKTRIAPETPESPLNRSRIASESPLQTLLLAPVHHLQMSPYAAILTMFTRFKCLPGVQLAVLLLFAPGHFPRRAMPESLGLVVATDDWRLVVTYRDFDKHSVKISDMSHERKARTQPRQRLQHICEPKSASPLLHGSASESCFTKAPT